MALSFFQRASFFPRSLATLAFLGLGAQPLISQAAITIKRGDDAVIDMQIEQTQSHYQVDPSLVQVVLDRRTQASATPDDCNVQYNYGRAIHQFIQPALDTIAQGQALNLYTGKLAARAEAAYSKAISLCPNHGRAHIMLGMELQQENRYAEAKPHLKVGLTLPEGSADWMIAASQYLLVEVMTQQVQPEDKTLLKAYTAHAKAGTYHGDMAKSLAQYIH